MDADEQAEIETKQRIAKEAAASKESKPKIKKEEKIDELRTKL